MSDTASSLPPPNPADPALRTEIATIQSDPNRWIYGRVLDKADSVLASRGGMRGFALYDELERDPKVGAVLDKRKAALVGREWEVQPGDETPEAEEIADLVRRALAGLSWNACVRDMLEALLKGVSMGEVIWSVVGNELMPRAIRSRDPRRFAFLDGEEGSAELRLLTRGAWLEGIAVPPRKFVVHRRQGKYDNPWGLGLGHRLFWPVFFKRQGIGFWLSALEKFGQPTVLGKYAPGTSDPEINKLLQALQAVASEAAVAIPDGMTAELLEAKRNGSFDGYTSLASYMDSDIAQVVLGETLTSDAGENGSRALGEVHDGVRLELTKADADELSDTLNNGFIRWIVELNRPEYVAAGKAMPKIWWDVSIPEDLVQRAERDTKIKALGYKPKPDYIDRTYGEGWVEAAPPAPPPPPPGAAPNPVAALFAEAGRRTRRVSTTLPAADDPRDAAELLAEQLGPMTGEAMEPWIARLRGVVEGGGSMQDVQAGLMAVYAEMDVEPLAALLGPALLVAELTGRNDLVEDRGKGDAA